MPFTLSWLKKSPVPKENKKPVAQQRIGWTLSSNQMQKKKAFAAWKDEGDFLGSTVWGWETVGAEDTSWASDPWLGIYPSVWKKVLRSRWQKRLQELRRTLSSSHRLSWVSSTWPLLIHIPSSVVSSKVPFIYNQVTILLFRIKRTFLNNKINIYPFKRKTVLTPQRREEECLSSLHSEITIVGILLRSLRKQPTKYLLWCPRLQSLKLWIEHITMSVYTEPRHYTLDKETYTFFLK